MTKEAKANNDFKSDVTRLTWQLKLFVAAMTVMDRVAPAVATDFMLSKFLQPRRKKDASYEAKLPAGARRITVMHNDIELAGWAWGETGPSILVIHGWESHTGRMLPLVKLLLGQGFRVVTLDAPGHGLSPKAETHLVDVGYAIKAMLEQHGPFEGVIAHSFGAAATAIMLAHEPHLMPEKLVLMSPMRDLAQQLDIFTRIAHLSPQGCARLKEQIAQRIGMPFEQCSTVEAVRAFTTPGLVVHDRHDTLIPYEGGATVAENWSGARFITTDGLGHRLGLGDDSVFSRVLAFLRDALPEDEGFALMPEQPRRNSQDRLQNETARKKVNRRRVTLDNPLALRGNDYQTL